jgi:hypothetical protein
MSYFPASEYKAGHRIFYDMTTVDKFSRLTLS